MVDARRAFEGELTCYLISWIPSAIKAALAPKPVIIDPDEINPWKPRPKVSKALAALREWRRKRTLEVQIREAKKRANANR